MTFEKIIQTIIGDTNDERAEGFLRFLSSKLWGLYNDYLMDKIKVAESEIVWNLNMPNAKENQIYNQTVEMPKVSSAQLPEVEILLDDVVGLEQDIHGLQLMVAPDKHSFAITGTPTLEHFRKDGATALSTFELTLKYHFSGMEMPAERPVLERKVQFVINQDPRKLWRDIPVDWENMTEPKYKKDDIQIDYVKVEALSDGTPQKDIVAASKRGRSHAQEGKPRDDHFKMSHMDNGWYIMAVADGAGSAKYSREGSRIVCEEVTNYCMAQLANSKDFESAVKQYNEHKTESESDARKAVGDYIYKIVGTAAFKAHKSINAEAAIKKLPAKQYATTLLLAICKKFEFGWFIATFWVGDGVICLYNKQAHTAEVLGVPDEGEYAGQTRFLTMPEIFKDATSLYQRLRFRIVDDFTALFLMSDGVSDPKFETDANLNNPDKWDALWTDLKENGVELTDDNEETKNQLLAWLDFWSPGNHDDRTIAILYEGEDVSQNISSETADEDNTSIPDVPETTSNEEEIAETPVEPSSTEDIEKQDQSAAEDVEPQKE
ncbi:PP2C family serine/threonine-protein phosphatase [Bacteroides acidifaciens]|uniref:PP2C family serine/threonine-protein phosphatase n=1 Tax=Bacteroides acidifaciens TaxID=85831 RepID=UPI00262B20A4|nr:PP2C family serine/threonine-protein phosphatase [Bacteroides acidifaciens]